MVTLLTSCITGKCECICTNTTNSNRTVYSTFLPSLIPYLLENESLLLGYVINSCHISNHIPTAVTIDSVQVDDRAQNSHSLRSLNIRQNKN